MNQNNRAKRLILGPGVFVMALLFFIICWPVFGWFTSGGNSERIPIIDNAIALTPLVIAFAGGMIFGRVFVWQIAVIASLTNVILSIESFYELSQIEGGWAENGGTLFAVQVSLIMVAVCVGLTLIGDLTRRLFRKRPIA